MKDMTDIAREIADIVYEDLCDRSGFSCLLEVDADVRIEIRKDLKGIIENILRREFDGF